jgi:hypothetical protein
MTAKRAGPASLAAKAAKTLYTVAHRHTVAHSPRDGEERLMPTWLRRAVGVTLAVSLLTVAGVQAYSERLRPLVQEYGTTYYNGDGPPTAPLICKPEETILTAIEQVHAKFDHLTGDSLQAFQTRARDLKGLPPLDVDDLYVITEDDKLRNGDMVLFIGLKLQCVKTVFGFSAAIYREILANGHSA